MIDRAAHRRTHPHWLEEALRAPEARLLLVWRDRSLLGGEGRVPEPVFVPAAAHPDLTVDRDVVFLGIDAHGPLFAVDLSERDEVTPPEGRFEDLRMAGAFMPREPFDLLAYARGICGWNRRTRHCEQCGGRLAFDSAGFKRVCTEGHEVFPRTDPAVMILVTHGDRCLLARQPRFPPGMYSALAGFVEPGESLEDCVRRETLEEVGLEVGEPRYVASQGWPFPQSFMLSFVTEATNDAFTLDDDELEEARWVTREELRDLFEKRSRAFFVPPPMSLANPLIRGFAYDD
ncbi:MAG: NAD(+) diphosphatase [Sandaracinus sp.]|nr:NAD(+) diphosphatase [Myxococcales bacterium]MCB9601357.1 NAD(+) diphosphatase [Sandaracinus sp.]